ncbi:MAG: ABC transporter permease [Armatimonadota bacterium]|nr:ABC transporter permease [Armatimonadota bacterium]
MSQQSPIADLSYRNYDGPKSLATARWWVIAKNGLRVSFKKKGLWVLFGMSSLSYLFMLFMMFMQSFTAEMGGEMLGTFRQQLVGTYGNAFWPLMIALLVGSGCIAADNRANALQVYLAKPMTKKDYLIGKWLYIFLIIFAIYIVPLFIVVMYRAFDVGFAEFFKSDGRAFFAMPLLAALPAALHASILVGISAWNKTPWIVGVIYAGVYFFSTIFAMILAGSISSPSATTDATLRHLSIEGIISGIGQFLLSAEPRSLTPGMESTARPSALPLMIIAAILIVAGVMVARMRIRAVEVVQG